MNKRIFVSYCHKQGEWVWKCLVPCLKAGGAHVRIDSKRFEKGMAVVGQKDTPQNISEVSVFVLSSDYFADPYCVREVNHALKRDSKDQNGLVVLVKREDCTLPSEIKKLNSLYVNLCDDNDAGQWDLLLNACEADLGTDAPHWLNIRNEIFQFLQRNQSVNLVVSRNPKWRELIEHLHKDYIEDFGKVNLESSATMSRSGLVTEILKACNAPTLVPSEPEDLVVLDRILSVRPLSRLAIEHFDLVVRRPYYDINLFAALRYLVMESRKLVLLVQSRSPFATLLPQDHPLSPLDIRTVELKGRK